jgi:hypothetical protein
LYTALIVIITSLVAIYISLPFFLSKGEQRKDEFETEKQFEDAAVEKLKSLNNQRDNLFTAIRDIEFDYGLKKLSKEDFEELNSKYKIEAAAVLKEIDFLESQYANEYVSSDIEQEIMSYRKSGRTNQNLDLELEKEISMFRSSPNASTANNCSKCGAEYNLEDVFCSKCGEKLN